MEHVLSPIGIIGAGELGRALGEALTAAREQVLYYDIVPERTTTASIEDLVRSCPVLLLCVPSWAVGDVTKQIRKAAHPGESRVVITMAKGVEKGFVTMDEALRRDLPDFYDFGVLYGPMIAEEIANGRGASGVLCLSKTSWFRPLREVFKGAGVQLQSSGDMAGVTLCAVFKNVYAIAFGLAEGMHLGTNAKGKLAVMALHEMKQILTDRRADPRTAEGIAGLGDLLATGLNEASFNYRVGKSLAEGIAGAHLKSEGLVALDECSRAFDLKKYPIAQVVNQIVFHYGAPAKLSEVIANN